MNTMIVIFAILHYFYYYCPYHGSFLWLLFYNIDQFLYSLRVSHFIMIRKVHLQTQVHRASPRYHYTNGVLWRLFLLAFFNPLWRQELSHAYQEFWGGCPVPFWAYGKKMWSTLLSLAATCAGPGTNLSRPWDKPIQYKVFSVNSGQELLLLAWRSHE